MKYVVFDSSGEIVVSGEVSGVPDDHGLGTLLEDVGGSNATHYVAGGALVPYTPEQASTKAARPDYDASWSNTTFSWVDTRGLGQAKAEQWAIVKAARDGSMLHGFTWDGSRFDADDLSQQRIQGAVQLAVLAAAAGQAFSIDWTLFDNTTRTLAGPDMIAVGQALGVFVQQVFATGVALRQRIDAAATVEEVKAVQWPA